MPLPTPSPRRHLHTRAVTYSGFLRDDGLWDIEAEMTDTRSYESLTAERGLLPVGAPVHRLLIRATIDEAMTIQAIDSAMDDTPFGECQQANSPMQRMVGVSMGPGWRRAIEETLGGACGCTHLRELLFNMATVAYQSVIHYRQSEHRFAGKAPAVTDKPPHHLGRCIAWDFNGAVVQRLYPRFAGWKPTENP